MELNFRDPPSMPEQFNHWIQEQEAKSIWHSLHQMTLHTRHAVYTACAAADLSHVTDSLLDTMTDNTNIGNNRQHLMHSMQPNEGPSWSVIEAGTTLQSNRLTLGLWSCTPSDTSSPIQIPATAGPQLPDHHSCDWQYTYTQPGAMLDCTVEQTWVASTAIQHHMPS